METQRYLAVATKAGPGGLRVGWVKTNIFLTATDERRILKVTPAKKVSTVAQGFEKDAKLAKGPNDLVVASNGTIFFPDPNGYYGDPPMGRFTEPTLAAKPRSSATRSPDQRDHLEHGREDSVRGPQHCKGNLKGRKVAASSGQALPDQ